MSLYTARVDKLAHICRTVPWLLGMGYEPEALAGIHKGRVHRIPPVVYSRSQSLTAGACEHRQMDPADI
jgi:hypothetical protein